MKEIQKITRHSLKEIFESEAGGFTPWLVSHIGHLSEALNGLNIVEATREHKLDTLRVDIVAKAGDDGESAIIIENQFGDSDSEHLGKLLSYAAFSDAKYAVWIVEKAREEHLRAIQMLNQAVATCGFYLLEASVISIAGSTPAISFNVIEKPVPNVEEKERTETENTLCAFWEAFIKYAKENDWQLERTPQPFHWLDIPCGTTKAHFSLFIRRGSASVQFIFSSPQTALNKKNYHLFEAQKESIEEAMGLNLQWEEMPDRRTSKISVTTNVYGGYERNKQDWDNIFRFFFHTYKKFVGVVTPFVCKIK